MNVAVLLNVLHYFLAVLVLYCLDRLVDYALVDQAKQSDDQIRFRRKQKSVQQEWLTRQGMCY